MEYNDRFVGLYSSLCCSVSLLLGSSMCCCLLAFGCQMLAAQLFIVSNTFVLTCELGFSMNAHPHLENTEQEDCRCNFKQVVKLRVIAKKNIEQKNNHVWTINLCGFITTCDILLLPLLQFALGQHKPGKSAKSSVIKVLIHKRLFTVASFFFRHLSQVVSKWTLYCL